MDSLHLLTSQDPQEVGKLAQQLEIQNRERQKVMRSIQEKAEQLAFLTDENPYILFAVDPDFNPGVVGLAASRLTEQYYRPSIIASQGETYTRASCRSIPEFHITQALDQCKELLEHHGGHAAAAGFTVLNKNLPELIGRLQTIAYEQLADKDLRPKIHADAEISLSDLSFDLLKYLERLQPTGMGNPEPVFMSSGIYVVSQRLVGSEGAHLKLVVTDGYSSPIDAIAFRQGHWMANLPETIDLMYTFGRNEFNGKVSLQLNVKDIRASEA
jgi:single-stranded-DNA-specific exonuclease